MALTRFYNTSRCDYSLLTGVTSYFPISYRIDFISFVGLLLPTGLRVHNPNWTLRPLILIPYATCYRIPMQPIDYDGDFPRFGTRNYAGGISIFRTDILLFIAKIKGLFPLAVVQARSQRAVEITRAEERIKDGKFYYF